MNYLPTTPYEKQSIGALEDSLTHILESGGWSSEKDSTVARISEILCKKIAASSMLINPERPAKYIDMTLEKYRRMFGGQLILELMEKEANIIFCNSIDIAARRKK